MKNLCKSIERDIWIVVIALLLITVVFVIHSNIRHSPQSKPALKSSSSSSTSVFSSEREKLERVYGERFRRIVEETEKRKKKEIERELLRRGW